MNRYMLIEIMNHSLSRYLRTTNCFIFRGDPSIVYLDGVNPPTGRMPLNRSQSTPENFYSSVGTNGMVMVKAHSNHHQRLLQTIREDDCESR